MTAHAELLKRCMDHHVRGAKCAWELRRPTLWSIDRHDGLWVTKRLIKGSLSPRQAGQMAAQWCAARSAAFAPGPCHRAILTPKYRELVSAMAAQARSLRTNEIDAFLNSVMLESACVTWRRTACCLQAPLLPQRVLARGMPVAVEHAYT